MDSCIITMNSAVLKTLACNHLRDTWLGVFGANIREHTKMVHFTERARDRKSLEIPGFWMPD